MTLSTPHGGTLVNHIDLNYNFSSHSTEIELDAVALSDLELIANGAYSPLGGFLGSEDYESVIQNMRLANGIVWSIPITLPISEVAAQKLRIGEMVKLTFHNETFGVLELQELYTPNKKAEADKVYQTTDPNHPGVKKLFERPNVYAAGPIILTKIPAKHPDFNRHYKTPLEIRKEFEKRNWNTVVGFQTRNPVHRAHEYIQKQH